MDSVQVNIVEYDELNHSVVAYFTGKLNDREYTTERYSFSITNFYSPSVENVIKNLAKVGKFYLQQIVDKESSILDTRLIDKLKSLSNSTHHFESEHLLEQPINNVEVVDDLEIQI